MRIRKTSDEVLSENGFAAVDLDETSFYSDYSGFAESENVSGTDNTYAPTPRHSHKKRNAAVISVLLASSLCLGLVSCGSRGGTAGYTEGTVTKRDIQTYRTFSGNINPVDYQNVFPEVTGVPVREILAEEGDEVKEGDILMILDSSSLEQQIKEKEASMTVSGKTSAISIEQAQTTYNNYKYNVDNGMDSQLNSAAQAMDSTFASLINAQTNYNNEVGLNNQSLSSTILNAMSSVTSAYGSVRSAQASLEAAQDAGGSTTSAEVSLSNAWASYESAKRSYEAAKINEENQLTSLFDTLIAAQISYLNAVDNYNTAVNSSNQTLHNYALQVESAQAQSDQSVSQIQLEHLYEQVEDCTIRAPRDGVVTAIDAKVGDNALSTKSLATVTSFDKMKIDIKINEYDIGDVHKGDTVTITLDALDKSYDGTISTISRIATVDNGVSYFTSEVEFDADEDARSGMSAEVRLYLTNQQGVPSIPSEAVQTESDGTPYVLVQGEREMVHQPVTTGASDGNYVEITDGLSEGDTFYYTPTNAMLQMMNDMHGGGDNAQ